MTPIPEEFGRLYGHSEAVEAARQALAGGRMHHGWLLRGPRGIGKARFALQFAAMLLGSKGPAFAISADDPVARLIVSGAHPDFRLLRRPVDDKGKMKSEIPADLVRTLSGFFSLAAAMGGRRVAIIDALDELNRFGANALLKTLEEPPPGAVIIAIAHGERPLLPTVRSRCRLLTFAPLAEADTRAALAQAGGGSDDTGLATGRPGVALRLSGPDAVASAAAARDLVARGRPALHELIATASRSEECFEAALAMLRRQLYTHATRESDAGAAGRLAGLVLDVDRLAAESRELNMDRTQTIASVATLVVQRLGGESVSRKG